MTTPPIDVTPIEVHCRNWADLVAKLQSLDRDWIFRGQRDARWLLETSLERYAPTHQEPRTSELEWKFEFERRAHLYLEPQHIPDDGDLLGWWALMQHFGAPTRLLDFTRSQYVAAYFAIEDDQKKTTDNPDPRCAVWAVSELWCSEMVGRLFRTSSTQEYDGFLKANKIVAGLDQRIQDIVFASNLRAGQAFEAAFLPPSYRKIVVPVQPHKLTERVSIQQGIFLAIGDIRTTFIENLIAMDGWNNRSNVIKFTVGIDERGRALEDLRRMNITRASLFPGLDGFAQSFKHSLVKEPRERRNIRDAILGLVEAFDSQPKPTNDKDDGSRN